MDWTRLHTNLTCLTILTNAAEAEDVTKRFFERFERADQKRPLLLILMPEYDRDQRLKLYSEGVDDIMRFPCDPAVLAIRIRALCKIQLEEQRPRY